MKENFVIDEKGNRKAIILDIKEYKRILTELEELESIRAYDAVKRTPEESIPFEQAIEEIESERK